MSWRLLTQAPAVCIFEDLPKQVALVRQGSVNGLEIVMKLGQEMIEQLALRKRQQLSHR
jgi:hypothetical protein